MAVAADRYCPTTRQYRGDENDDDSFESDEEDMRELNTNKKYEVRLRQFFLFMILYDSTFFFFRK